MADSQPSKRRVKNPETFRERAVKANEPEKPSKIKRLLALIWRPLELVLKPLGHGIALPFRYPPLKWLRRPARIAGRVLLPRYIRNSWRELRLVTWPGWKESRRLTFAVLAFAIIFGAAIAGVDYGLDKVFKHILLK